MGALGLAPSIIAVATLVSVPVLINSLGSSLWLSIALGQAAGEIGRSITVWGWSTVALAKAASLSPEHRIIYYKESLAPRFMLFVLVGLIFVVLGNYIFLESPEAFIVLSISGALLGLSSSWYFISSGKPELTIYYDAVPRFLGIVFGTIFVYLFSDISWFIYPVLLGNIISVSFPIYVISKFLLANIDNSFKSVIRRIVEGTSAFSIGFAQTSRIGLPVLMSPILIPGYSEYIVLAEKFVRWGNTALTPIIQFSLAKSSAKINNDRRGYNRIIITVSLMTLLIGILASIGIYYFSPIVSAGVIQLPPIVCISFATVLSAIYFSSVIGNGILSIVGKLSSVAKISVLCSLCLPLVVIIFTELFKFNGFVITLALIEIIIASIIMIFALKGRK